ncbi:MAG: DNA recombination protein RmuC [Spirochaetia bacterium]|jgi:DNA recombination protein RmuC
MLWLYIFLACLVGLVIGFLIAWLLRSGQLKTARGLAEELYSRNKLQADAQSQAMLESVKSVFKDLSSDALSRSSQQFLQLAETRLTTERQAATSELDTKKQLIDQHLLKITSELEKVASLVTDFEKDRTNKFGELSAGIRGLTSQSEGLRSITTSLREALSSTQSRGQWGQRMAEDVLRLAGFVEGVNYSKQQQAPDSRDRPDFTFFLPRDLTLNMDAKFPLSNYLRFLEATNDSEKESFRRDFLRDVRARLKEVTTRDYINAEGKTVDYVLLFIPNESVFAFIHEQDKTIMDEALQNHVILCSPMTLFAVLAVIHQSVQNFALEQASNEILSLFGSFKKQWLLFVKKLDSLGERIESVAKEYDALATTRRRQLEKPLDKIEDLRAARALPVDTGSEEGGEAEEPE